MMITMKEGSKCYVIDPGWEERMRCLGESVAFPGGTGLLAGREAPPCRGGAYMGSCARGLNTFKGLTDRRGGMWSAGWPYSTGKSGRSHQRNLSRCSEDARSQVTTLML